VKGLFTTGTLTRRLAANCFRRLVLSGEQEFHVVCCRRAKNLQSLAEKGAQIIGGCCGTTIEHIRAMVNELPDTIGSCH